MSKKEIISTRAAPQAIGPYSQAVWNGSELFCSGQTPIDPATGTLITGDVAEQTHRVFDNLAAVLAAAGLSLADRKRGPLAEREVQHPIALIGQQRQFREI